MGIFEEVERRNKQIAKERELALAWDKLPGGHNYPLQVWPSKKMQALLTEVWSGLQFDTLFVRWMGPDQQYRISLPGDLPIQSKQTLDAGGYGGAVSFVYGTVIQRETLSEKSHPESLHIYTDGSISIISNGRQAPDLTLKVYETPGVVREMLVKHFVKRSQRS